MKYSVGVRLMTLAGCFILMFVVCGPADAQSPQATRGVEAGAVKILRGMTD